MKKIYICSPYRGNVERNVRMAIRYCKKAISQGYAPVAPHLYLPQMLDDNKPAERDKALQIGLKLLEGCDELWVCGLDSPTEGMRGEIVHARKSGIPVHTVII